jgi:hypothetical protein
MASDSIYNMYEFSELECQAFNKKLFEDKHIMAMVDACFTLNLIQSYEKQETKIDNMTNSEILKITERIKNYEEFYPEIVKKIFNILNNNELYDKIPPLFELILINIYFYLILHRDVNYKLNPSLVSKYPEYMPIVRLLIELIQKNFNKYN